MSSGFNTDVHVGDQIFHVQTEDRGPSHPVIDTAVYQHGRILHRLASDYQEFAGSTEFSADGLRERVNEQHRRIIEDLRAGVFDAEIAAALELAVRTRGIQVQLLNPTSWLAGGNVLLDVEIVRRADRQPQAGAQVEAAIEGAAQAARHAGVSDDRGRVRIEFPLPPLGKGNLALVIHAQADAGKDEIRFSMRSRTK
ncbi:MAG: hypothetical protein P4L00_00560 [Candidatus Acidoferrales bacterium]|nr:hypothetical protein [Candidatus Acidoferrales bacterium]